MNPLLKIHCEWASNPIQNCALLVTAKNKFNVSGNFFNHSEIPGFSRHWAPFIPKAPRSLKNNPGSLKSFERAKISLNIR